MATGTTKLKFNIQGDMNPGKHSLLQAFSGAFDKRPDSVTFTVEDGGQSRKIVVQVIRLEYESGGPDKFNIGGYAEFEVGLRIKIRGYYNTSRRIGYIEPVE
mgnify:FL=1